MGSTHTGTTQISCQATLENQQMVVGKLQSHIYDAIIDCTNVLAKTQEVLCSLRYYTPKGDDIPGHGIYDITARVIHFMHQYASTHSTFRSSHFRCKGTLSASPMMKLCSNSWAISCK